MTEGPQLARVLVVDSDRHEREQLTDALSGHAEAVSCADAAAAARLLSAGAVDLILCEPAAVAALWPVRGGDPAPELLVLGGPGADAAASLPRPVRPEHLAPWLARAGARRRLLAENQRLHDEVELYRTCRSLAGCLEPEDLFAMALDLSLRGLGLRSGFAVYQRGELPGSDGFHARGVGESEELALRDALLAKPLDLPHGPPQRQDRGALHDALRRVGLDVGPLLVVPVRGEEEGGMLCLFGEAHGLSDRALARAAVIGEHAALALRNAERYRVARERAFVDDVTEVYNARYLLEAVDREIRRSERYGTELSILFIDLDRFKLVNDTHGHLVGSNTLRQLSRLLENCVRQVDTVARYGGDEFTILLADTGARLGRSVGERIRGSVERHAFEAGPGRTLSLTCSVGVSTYPAHGRTREALLDAADKAMYRAKSLGRNRLCSADELE